MSSDYLVSTEELQAVGVTLEDATCEYSGDPITFATFPDYPYRREVCSHDGTTNISCSGQFRNWLEDFLKSNHMSFNEF